MICYRCDGAGNIQSLNAPIWKTWERMPCPVCNETGNTPDNDIIRSIAVVAGVSVEEANARLNEAFRGLCPGGLQIHSAEQLRIDLE